MSFQSAVKSIRDAFNKHAYFKAVEKNNLPRLRSILVRHPEAIAWKEDVVIGEGYILGDGNTGLIIAIKKNHLKAAQILLDHGANIEDTNTYCETALRTAVTGRSEDSVDFLLARGADPLCSPKADHSALEAARLLNLPSIVAKLEAAIEKRKRNAAALADPPATVTPEDLAVDISNLPTRPRVKLKKGTKP